MYTCDFISNILNAFQVFSQAKNRPKKKRIFSIFYKIVKNNLRFPKRRSRLFLVGKTRLNLQGRPEKDLARNVIFREVTNTEKKIKELRIDYLIASGR